MRHLKFSAVLPAAALAAPLAAQARGFYDGLVGGPAGMTRDAFLAGGFPYVYGLFALVSLVTLALLIIWILMIIDCAGRDWPQRPVWLVILVASFFVGLHWLAAILYYFLVKRRNPGRPPAAPTAPQPPAA